MESNFEQFLEADIKRLAEEIQTHRERPETSTFSEKELLKEALQTAVVEQVPTASVQANATAQSPLPDYAQDAPAETKLEIEYLLDVAFRKGLMEAEAESRKSPEFVQDAFHDALTGRLYPELVRQGILK